MKRFLIVLFFASSSAFGQDCADIPDLNKQIAEIAKSKFKKKVGRGECWDLAQYVLDGTAAEWDGYEVYGRLIDRKTECVYPGDIIQFEKIKLEYEKDGFIYSESMYHHTAIVFKVLDNNEVILLHQNTEDHGKKVGESSLKFDSITSGKLLIYRPVN
jgi:hypothetical protein